MNINLLTDEAIHQLSFEDALHALEEAVQMLEDGKLPLDEAVKIFEQGNKLRHYCEQKLNEAKLNVEKVIQSSQNQLSASFEPFKESV